jgi:hypothetical protein
VLASQRDYPRRFGDVEFWAPYVGEVLRRHGLPDGVLTAGAGGTFPAFLVGAYVVKFFPSRFDGGACFVIEHTLHTRGA